MLKQLDKKLIVDAISKAELRTTAEIKIHICPKCKGDELLEAKKVFEKLGLTKTAQKNAVLIFVAYNSHKIAVLGDSGINNLVPENFWNNVYEIIRHEFASKNYTSGFVKAVDEIADQLETYFPSSSENKNEISNDISGQ